MCHLGASVHAAGLDGFVAWLVLLSTSLWLAVLHSTLSLHMTSFHCRQGALLSIAVAWGVHNE